MSKSTVLSLTLLVCISAFAFAVEEADDAYSRGLEAYESGNLEDAISYFKLVYETNPEYQAVRDYLFKAYKFFGVEYYSNGRYEEAIELWWTAMEIDPDNAEVQSYISRTRGEMEAMARISGENPVAAADASLSELITADTEQANEGAMITSPTVPVAAPHPLESNGNRLPIVTTLKAGPAFPVGKTTEKHNVGWQLSGSISHNPERFPLGLCLEGIYIRLPVNMPPAALAGTEGIISMTGAGANAVLAVRSPGMLDIKIAAGPGLYEVVKAGYNINLMREDTDIDLSPGYSLALVLTSKLKKLSVNTEVRYLHIRSPLAPDLLQLFIGLNARL